MIWTIQKKVSREERPMSVKKRGKMGEKTEEGCRELLKKIKTNWPSSHVLNTAAAHPGRDTGLPRQPDQTAGRG